MKYIYLKLTIIFLVLITFFAPSAMAAKMNFVVDSKLTSESNLIVDLKINSEGIGINASEATIKFPQGILSVSEINRSGSIFNFWLEEPSFSNERGEIKFIGGSTTGYSGQSLQVLRIAFRINRAGSGQLSVTDGAITASDGNGTNVFVSDKGIEIKGLSEGSLGGESAIVQIQRPIVPAAALPVAPKIEVSLYPDQNAWNSAVTPFIARWELPRDITAVATLIDKNPKTIPTKSEGLFDNKIFQTLEDGVWYLHVRFRNSVGWGPVGHYKIAIDSRPPLPFEIKLSSGISSDNPTPKILLTASDQPSGIDEYEIIVDKGKPVVIKNNELELQPLMPGSHSIKVIAKDLAGNSIESALSFEVLPIDSPIIYSVSDTVFTGDGNLIIAGSASPNISLMLTVKNKKEEKIETISSASDDSGNWSLRIDHPLKKGVYYVEAVAIDSRKARSLPVISPPILVRDKPIMILGNISITPIFFYFSIIITLVALFVLGRYLDYRKRGKRSLNITLVNRDIINIMNLMRKDIEDIRKNINSMDPVSGAKVERNLQNMESDLSKMDKYIIEDIEKLNH